MRAIGKVVYSFEVKMCWPTELCMREIFWMDSHTEEEVRYTRINRYTLKNGRRV